MTRTLNLCILVHLVAGCIYAAALAELAHRYLFCHSGDALGVVVALGAAAWFVVAAAVGVLVSRGRRRPWLLSVIWLVVAVAAVETTAALQPPEGCNFGFM